MVGEVRLSPYCYTCTIRACAHGKGYATCADVMSMQHVERSAFITETPSAGVKLASLRQR